MSDPCIECGRSDDYEEITLGDLVDTLRRRKKILAVTFAVVLLGSLAITLVQDPVHESSAVIVATNEREELLALINSPAFEDAVRDANGHEMDISGSLGPLDVPADQRRQITITFQGEGADIQGASQQAMLVLDGLQDQLRDVTWSKNWQKYYEAAGKDEAKATAQLQTLVDGMSYFEVVSESTPGAKVSPNLQLNLALGVVLGLMLAVFGAFTVEWFGNYRAQRPAN